jgi:hypothetical protein
MAVAPPMPMLTRPAHASSNIAVIGRPPASTGPGARLWVGQSGIIVMLTMIAAAVAFTRGPVAGR